LASGSAQNGPTTQTGKATYLLKHITLEWKINSASNVFHFKHRLFQTMYPYKILCYVLKTVWMKILYTSNLASMLHNTQLWPLCVSLNMSLQS
jgi:hypothetical protein